MLAGAEKDGQSSNLLKQIEGLLGWARELSWGALEGASVWGSLGLRPAELMYRDGDCPHLWMVLLLSLSGSDFLLFS